jgi:hypothetical protein
MKLSFLVLAGIGLAAAADPGWQISKANRDMEDGHPERAWERYLRAEEDALRRGDREAWIIARSQRTELLLLSEEVSAADSLRPHLSSLEETAIDSARIRLTAARVLLAAGHPETAQQEAWAAHLAAHNADDDLLEAACWIAISRSESLQGKAVAARQSLAQARSLADGEPHLAAQADLEEARQLSAAPTKALRLVRKAKEAFRQAHWPSGVLLSQEREALLLETLDQKDAAAQAWQEVQAQAQRLGLEATARRAGDRLQVGPVKQH